MGAFSIIIAVYTESLVETIQRGFSFWMPAVVIPLLAGLFSLRKEPRSYYASFTLGTSAIIICMILGVVNSAITLIAILASLLGYVLIGKRVKDNII
jgi:predicted branched-subunit amino acid permease